MKRGGRLAIVVPNLESTCARRYGRCWVGLDPPRHVVDFTCASLRKALERAGFAVESVATSPVGAANVALFSGSRASGDPRETYTDWKHPFPWHRRTRAAVVGLVEQLACAVGRPAGEEVVAVARRPQ
jgi:hypothetical protein